MARRTLMHRLARWHVWLGWIVGLPILMWTATGLFMVLRPIEEVRGESLRRAPAPMQTEGLLLPRLRGPVKRLALVEVNGAPSWAVTYANGAVVRYNKASLPVPEVDEAEARAIANAALKSPPVLISLRRFAASEAPRDLGKARPCWQATFADDTHLYVDSSTGEVLAIRTRWWRAFDFMWGLHILDPQDREDSSHPLLIGLAALSLLGSMIGCALLFRRRKARVA